MMIKIIAVPGGSLKYKADLVGLSFEAKHVRAVAPRPNTAGFAWEIDTYHAAQVLNTAGKREAAAYFASLNQFPAMQTLGFCIELTAAEQL